MITIDGSAGEGGGQILRTSLALSLCTGEPVRIEKIRAGRARPGLMRQHLTAVKAAAEVGRGEVFGTEIGSREVELHPKRVEPGSFHFSVGTAGSTTLVLQTVLPALLAASGPSELVLEGGTHNPLAPPFAFLEEAFLPLLARMGPQVSAELEEAGFYPAGGGRIRVRVTPSPLGELVLRDRGEVQRKEVVAVIANLSGAIAKRELEAAKRVLGWEPECFRIAGFRDTRGPGNVVHAIVASEHVTEVFTAFGERGVSAEAVGTRVAEEARAYLAAGAPVGPYLADQLLLPMALGKGGAFRTTALSLHARTQIDLLMRLTSARVETEEMGDGVVEVRVVPRG